jgi:hypothetical protein
VPPVYFLRIEFSGWNLDSAPLTVYGAALDFSGQESPDGAAEQQSIVELLDFAFFDDDTTVLLVRIAGKLAGQGQHCIPQCFDVNGSGFRRNRVPCSSNAHLTDIPSVIRSKRVKCNGGVQGDVVGSVPGGSAKRVCT